MLKTLGNVRDLPQLFCKFNKLELNLFFQEHLYSHVFLQAADKKVSKACFTTNFIDSF